MEPDEGWSPLAHTAVRFSEYWSHHLLLHKIDGNQKFKTVWLFSPEACHIRAEAINTADTIFILSPFSNRHHAKFNKSRECTWRLIWSFMRLTPCRERIRFRFISALYWERAPCNSHAKQVHVIGDSLILIDNFKLHRQDKVSTKRKSRGNVVPYINSFWSGKTEVICIYCLIGIHCLVTISSWVLSRNQYN